MYSGGLFGAGNTYGNDRFIVRIKRPLLSIQDAVVSDNLVPVCSSEGDPCAIREEFAQLKAQVEELSELVRTDPLTGLFNFRHFNQSLSHEMERTGRTGDSTILIMVDLDHFKHVNDRWGHETGNQALQLAARLMTESVRKLDVCCRYGGEEFAVILPMTDLVTGTLVAERIRKAIDDAVLEVNGEDIGLTASLGVAAFSSYQREQPEHFVERADQYLYDAKQAGRNQVCHEHIESMKTDSSVSMDEKAALFGLPVD